MLPGEISAIIIASLLGVGSLFLGHRYKKTKEFESKRRTDTRTLKANEFGFEDIYTEPLKGTNFSELYENAKKEKKTNSSVNANSTKTGTRNLYLKRPNKTIRKTRKTS